MVTHQPGLRLVALGLAVSATIGSAMAQQQVRTVLQPVNVDHLRTNEVLGIPTSHCGHVIDLLMHNRIRQQRENLHGRPQQIHMAHLSVPLTPGDLELVCVHLVCDGNATTGPIFEIGMRNNSQIPIGNFRISLVGVLGQIHVHAPTATVHVPRLEAGQESQIRIQLPVTCMSMGLIGQRAEFDTLIVALDSYDELLECDELNNVQILKRCDIGLLVAPTNAPVVPESGPAQAAPAPSAPSAAVPAVPETPESSPLDNIDLDKLNLDSAQGSAVRLR